MNNFIVQELLSNGMFDKFVIYRDLILPKFVQGEHGVICKSAKKIGMPGKLLNTVGLNDFYKEIDEFNIMYDCDCLKIMNNFSHSLWEKKKRSIRRAENIIACGNYCVFLTFTFNDDSLLDHNKKEDLKDMKTMLTRYLKEVSDNYMANVDFGGHTNRFHFHCLCHLKEDHFIRYVDKRCELTKRWDNGFTYCEVVDVSAPVDAVAKYVAKLSAHSIKTKAFKSNMIVSRMRK